MLLTEGFEEERIYKELSKIDIHVNSRTVEVRYNILSDSWKLQQLIISLTAIVHKQEIPLVFPLMEEYITTTKGSLYWR